MLAVRTVIDYSHSSDNTVYLDMADQSDMNRTVVGLGKEADKV